MESVGSGHVVIFRIFGKYPKLKRAASPIFPSVPKCSSRHFIVCFAISSEPSIVFSPQKPFYSQPNDSSWWWGFFFASPDVNKNKKVTEITPITIQVDRTIVTPNYNLHIAIRSDSNNSAIFAKYGLSPIHFHNCTCCVILPSISLHVQEICIIKFVIFPWFLHITTIKWKYLLTIFFFSIWRVCSVPRGPFLISDAWYNTQVCMWLSSFSYFLHELISQVFELPNDLPIRLLSQSSHHCLSKPNGWPPVCQLRSLFRSFKYS